MHLHVKKTYLLSSSIDVAVGLAFCKNSDISISNLDQSPKLNICVFYQITLKPIQFIIS